MKTCKKCGVEHNKKSHGAVCFVCKNGVERYGLDRKQQLALLEKQNNKCAICDDPITLHERKQIGYKKAGNIDHCHTTNMVRGVLCHACNVTLGYLENKNISLDKIKRYASVSPLATNQE